MCPAMWNDTLLDWIMDKTLRLDTKKYVVHDVLATLLNIYLLHLPRPWGGEARRVRPRA